MLIKPTMLVQIVSSEVDALPGRQSNLTIPISVRESMKFTNRWLAIATALAVRT
jgi:hypothetical protein